MTSGPPAKGKFKSPRIILLTLPQGISKPPNHFLNSFAVLRIFFDNSIKFISSGFNSRYSYKQYTENAVFKFSISVLKFHSCKILMADINNESLELIFLVFSIILAKLEFEEYFKSNLYFNNFFQ